MCPVQIFKFQNKSIFAPGTRNRGVTITGQPSAIAKAQILTEHKINDGRIKPARQIVLTVFRNINPYSVTVTRNTSLLRQWELEIKSKVYGNQLTTCVHHGQNVALAVGALPCKRLGKSNFSISVDVTKKAFY
uniref:Uncharacterized protein n=1 Tax=Glossina austeni TaxID=7395 RepID=A0A1A9V7R2_GLOAU